jgi:hypothetical protein
VTAVEMCCCSCCSAQAHLHSGVCSLDLVVLQGLRKTGGLRAQNGGTFVASSWCYRMKCCDVEVRHCLWLPAPATSTPQRASWLPHPEAVPATKRSCQLIGCLMLVQPAVSACRRMCVKLGLCAGEWQHGKSKATYHAARPAGWAA